MNQNICRSSWTTITKYIDQDTGEIMTHEQYKENYITTKTIKNAKKSKFGTGGIVEYTKLCRRNPQQKLNFSE